MHRAHPRNHLEGGVDKRGNRWGFMRDFPTAPGLSQRPASPRSKRPYYLMDGGSREGLPRWIWRKMNHSGWDRFIDEGETCLPT